MGLKHEKKAIASSALGRTASAQGVAFCPECKLVKWQLGTRKKETFYIKRQYVKTAF